MPKFKYHSNSISDWFSIFIISYTICINVDICKPECFCCDNRTQHKSIEGTMKWLTCIKRNNDIDGVPRLAYRRIVISSMILLQSKKEFARIQVIEPVSITISHDYGLNCMIVELLSFVFSDVDKWWTSKIFLHYLWFVAGPCLEGSKIG